VSKPMATRLQNIKLRSGSYAFGKRASGAYTAADEAALSQGWEDGYEAALRDVKGVAQGLIDDTCSALTNSLVEVATAAAEHFKEEMEKIK
jgi:hypothetical protein